MIIIDILKMRNDKELVGMCYRTEVRNTPSDIYWEYDYDYEKAKENFKKCNRCGFYFQIERGASEVVIEGVTHDDICEDCLLETEGGNKFDELGYFLEDTLEDYYNNED